MLMPGEYVLRRDVADGAVQTDVIVMVCFSTRLLRYLNGRVLSPFPAEAGHVEKSPNAAYPADNANRPKIIVRIIRFKYNPDLLWNGQTAF